MMRTTLNPHRTIPPSPDATRQELLRQLDFSASMCTNAQKTLDTSTRLPVYIYATGTVALHAARAISEVYRPAALRQSMPLVTLLAGATGCGTVAVAAHLWGTVRRPSKVHYALVGAAFALACVNYLSATKAPPPTAPYAGATAVALNAAVGAASTIIFEAFTYATGSQRVAQWRAQAQRVKEALSHVATEAV